MQLSNRLKAVADLVTYGNRVADVGCDHAYISIYLIDNNIAPSAIAMDVNKGPLERAKENIDKFEFRKRIQVRLSDGLKKLAPEEADTILIAGMGGALMVKILKEGSQAVLTCKELILQPQSEIHLVRRYLHQIKFTIIQEKMLIDDGKYYVVMKAIPSEKNYYYDREVFYQYGKLLLEQKETVLLEYLLREKRIREQVIDALNSKTTKNTWERLEEIRKELSYIEEGLSYYNDED